jgi:hypothetical protein
MLLLAIVPTVVSLATSVLAYGRPMAPYTGHYDLVGSPPSGELPSDLMKEIDELLDKIFNISSENTESEPPKTDTTDPWANINIDPYMTISTDDEWCPHGEGNYCGEYVGKDSSNLYHCSVYDGKAHWMQQEVCSKGCTCEWIAYF